MEPVDLANVARRPQQWNVDGLPELVMGLLWITWAPPALARRFRARGLSSCWLFTPVLLVMGGVGAVWVIKRLKARLTFPRTGFVEWREPSRRQRVTAAAVAVVTARVLARAVMRGGPSAGHATPLLGVILALSFVVVSMKQRAPHSLALGAVALAAGLALDALNGGWMTVNWMFMIVGAASAAVGAVRLAIFLRKHPLAEAAS
jgi:hypothetical protein